MLTNFAIGLALVATTTSAQWHRRGYYGGGYPYYGGYQQPWGPWSQPKQPAKPEGWYSPYSQYSTPKIPYNPAYLEESVYAVCSFEEDSLGSLELAQTSGKPIYVKGTIGPF